MMISNLMMANLKAFKQSAISTFFFSKMILLDKDNSNSWIRLDSNFRKLALPFSNVTLLISSDKMF